MKKNMKLNLIENLLVLYFSILGFSFFSNLYIDAFVVTCINILVVLNIILKRENYFKKREFKLYICLLIITFFMIVNLSITTSSWILIFIRVLRIVSFVQLYLLFSMKSKIVNFRNVIIKTLNIFMIIGIAIVIDAFVFNLIGISIWPPIIYGGARYAGPFIDSNYLSIYYCIIFIILKYSGLIKKNRLLFMILSIYLIFLGKSWSSILILIFSIFSIKLIKIRSIKIKYMSIALIYISFIGIIKNNIIEFRKIFTELLINIGINPVLASEKVFSLEKRFNIQFRILEELEVSKLGLGARGVMDKFGLDSHNSYFGVLGDLGILGLVLLLVTMYIKILKYNTLIDVITTFLFFQCIFIDLFFVPIYWFTLFIIVYINNENKRRVSLE